MKKMILGFAAMVMVTCSFAQLDGQHHKQHPGMRQRHHGMNDNEKLNLTDAQKQQMKMLNDNFRHQMQDLNSKENITVKEQRDQRLAIVKAHKLKMEEVFTPEQKQQLAQQKQDMAKKRQEMAENRLAKMKEKLNLSDAQVASIKSNQQSTHNKIEVLMKDDTIDRAGKKQQLLALKEEMKNNMDKVLTPDQKIKMEEFKKENQQKMNPHKGHRMQNDPVK